jgi:phenolic acid decarboxylase
VTQTDAIASFDDTTISYTYDNGWSFTNTFDGHTRISVLPRRGEPREHVQMTELRPGVYRASWIDGEMGLLAQVIDLENHTVLAAIPVENDNGTEIINGTITSHNQGQHP